MKKLKGELSQDEAKSLIKNGKIVYPVIDLNNQIVKVFDYHKESFEYATSQGLTAHNITHPKCPRSVKFDLGYLEQLDLFLDEIGVRHEKKTTS
jgi:hypothetical protein